MEKVFMKVATIMGSPKKEGNTATVLVWVEKELKKEGHLIDHINIVDYNVNGCMGCYYCKQDAKEPTCKQQDDAAMLFKRLVSTDVIIYASPLYCWGFTAQLKAFIDRHICMVNGFGTKDWQSMIENKRTGLLVTCAGPDGENTDPIKANYKAVMQFLKCRVMDMLVIPFTTTPENLSDDAKKKAIRFAEKLVG
jgi:multimeric flavodoxin WrbA